MPRPLAGRKGHAAPRITTSTLSLATNSFWHRDAGVDGRLDDPWAAAHPDPSSLYQNNPSTASVPITVFLYGPLLSVVLMCPLKGQPINYNGSVLCRDADPRILAFLAVDDLVTLNFYL